MLASLLISTLLCLSLTYLTIEPELRLELDSFTK